MQDLTAVVPRNSIVEANQSGLIAEPLLDITPQLPLPKWHAGPADPGCDEEGAIVCVNGRYFTLKQCLHPDASLSLYLHLGWWHRLDPRVISTGQPSGRCGVWPLGMQKGASRARECVSMAAG